ncbi:MAG: hypothetical protein ACYTGR_05190 [Planctomycetota bacterium]|jgi:hypothetical protein
MKPGYRLSRHALAIPALVPLVGAMASVSAAIFGGLEALLFAATILGFVSLVLFSLCCLAGGSASMLARLGVAALLAFPLLFCGFGFLASFEPPGSLIFKIGYGAGALALLANMAWLIVGWFVPRLRLFVLAPGLCPDCEYDLSNLGERTQRCPECGRPIKPAIPAE